MKTLEQLGISPTPWKVGDAIPYREEHVVYTENHRHNDGSRHNKVIATCNQYFEERIADARLIAAAPELYEALRMYQEAFVEIRKSAWFLDANFFEIMSFNKVMTAADAALAKAAGESEERND